MHKRVHVYIAKELFRKLSLPKDYERIFVRAIVEPDNWRRRNPRRKHHYLQHSTILGYVNGARRAYINGDISACLSCLGVALHYIQDAFIPSPRTKKLRKIHARLEGKTGLYKSETLSMLRDAINEGFMVSVSSPKFIESVLLNIRWIYDEEEILKRAAKASAMVTAAVLGPKDPPSGLHEKYRMLKKEHDKRVLKASIASLISLATGSILTLLFTDLFALFLFIFFVTAPILSFGMIVFSDKEFYEVKEEADWYGIQ